MRKVVVLLGLIALLNAMPAVAQVGQTPKADARIKALLDKAEIKYKIDEDGDFRIINKFDNGRTQVVFIYSHTMELGDMEIREVWSVGYMSDGVMPAAIAKELLRHNARVKLGAWELGKFSGKEAGVFRAKIAAVTDITTLLITLHAVSETADEKEKELLGNDDL